MALVAEETKVITIDDRSIAVETLGEPIRQLIAFYDDWKQRELEQRSVLMSMQTAMRSISQQIAQAIQAAEAEATESAEPAANDAGDDAGDEAVVDADTSDA